MSIQHTNIPRTCMNSAARHHSNAGAGASAKRPCEVRTHASVIWSTPPSVTPAMVERVDEEFADIPAGARPPIPGPNTPSLAALLLILSLLVPFSGSRARANEDAEQTGNFKNASTAASQQLQNSLKELSELRETIADKKVPLNRRLNELEAELVAVRREYQETSRKLDNRTLDLSNLRSEIKAREEEKTYLSNLLGEYIRSFETRLHVAEMQRYEDTIEQASLAPESETLTDQQVYERQNTLVAASIDRLEAALGGDRFEGDAVDETGLVTRGTFALLGPAAFFRSDDGEKVGTAEQRLGSVAPAILAFDSPEDQAAAATVIETGSGDLPFDPTLGNAHKVEATQETLLEHISKGGVVMYPILGLAGAALLVALFKWVGLLLTRNPSQKRIRQLLSAVAEGNWEAAKEQVGKVGGPTGKMLSDGVAHLNEPRELIEEVMYERVLATRLKLQRLLPFIAICAASAPLLGLLGTVTGIINTFKLITVFGSGDVKTLSGGISEALITTEFGLIVAIPSLLLHAFLSRKARGVVDGMEKAAVSFINQIAKRKNSGCDGSNGTQCGEHETTGGEWTLEHHEEKVPQKQTT